MKEQRIKKSEEIKAQLKIQLHCPNCGHDDVEREGGACVTRCYNCGYFAMPHE